MTADQLSFISCIYERGTQFVKRYINNDIIDTAANESNLLKKKDVNCL